MRTHDQSTRPDPTALPRSTPAGQGVDAAGIDRFLDAVAAADDIELHSLLVVRHGHVVAEAWWHPYQPDTPRLLYSLSKSFTATALGFAVDEGLVELDATVLSYFPEFDRLVTDERSRSIRVRHVAAMASGHDDETIGRAAVAGDGDLLLGLLLIAPDREPGTVFAYNQPCTYALSAILQKVSGASLTEFLRPRLFAPLGISAYGWQADAVGRDLGYSGFHATTEAVAKLGQLYLRNGEWAGRQLLSAEWVAEATRAHIATNPDPNSNSDWDRGYGFQFWRSRHGYRGDGAFGQFCLVLPDLDLVVATTADTEQMQAVLDAVWEHLLPAVDRASSPSDDEQLTERLAALALAPYDGPAAAAAAAAAAAVPAGRHVLAPAGGESAGQPSLVRVEVEPQEGGWRIDLVERVGPAPGNEVRSKVRIRSRTEAGSGASTGARAGASSGAGTGTDARTPGRLADAPGWTITEEPVPMAASGGVDGDVLVADLILLETPHRLTLRGDLSAGTFDVRWRTAPLGGPPLCRLRSPSRS